jgi:hypothetical protein
VGESLVSGGSCRSENIFIKLAARDLISHFVTASPKISLQKSVFDDPILQGSQ